MKRSISAHVKSNRRKAITFVNQSNKRFGCDFCSFRSNEETKMDNHVTKMGKSPAYQWEGFDNPHAKNTNPHTHI